MSPLSSTEPPADDVSADDVSADDVEEGTAGTDATVGADSTATEDGTSTPEPQATPVDDARLAILDALAAELGDDLVATEIHRDDVWVRVRRQGWKRTAEVCRSLGFDYFCFLAGLDWMPATSVTRGEVSSEIDAGDDGEGEAEAQADAVAEAEAQPDQVADTDGWTTGHAGGDTRFQVFARLYSIERHMGITLKSDLDDDTPAVETWSQVYPGADWHERETWEMFGFDFVGHPHLVHLYLPGEFEGFPLRKDFPLLAREVKPWPGLVDVEPMPEGDDDVPANGEAAPEVPANTEEPAGQEAGS